MKTDFIAFFEKNAGCAVSVRLHRIRARMTRVRACNGDNERIRHIRHWEEK